MYMYCLLKIVQSLYMKYHSAQFFVNSGYIHWWLRH